MQGYCDACNGGNGIPPALPPKSYWSSRYKSAEGSQKVDAWFAGYPAGAQAAEVDGAGNFHEIKISNELAMTLSRAQEYTNGAIVGSALPSVNKLAYQGYQDSSYVESFDPGFESATSIYDHAPPASTLIVPPAETRYPPVQTGPAGPASGGWNASLGSEGTNHSYSDPVIVRPSSSGPGAPIPLRPSNGLWPQQNPTLNTEDK